MSLKDRLNSTKQIVEKKQIEQAPVYYSSDEVANQFDSLGALDNLLIDDEINSIFVSGAKNIFIEKKGKSFKSTTTFRDNIQLENLIKRYVQNADLKLNENCPYAKFNHKEGINVSVTLPPLSNNATIFVKCFKDKFANMQTIQEEQSISKEMALIIEAFNVINYNVVIAGQKNTLKTTLLSAMTKKMPTKDRGIVIDYSNELNVNSSNFTMFNFATLKYNEQKDILNSLVRSNPNKIYINDCDEKMIDEVALKSIDGYKGFIMTLDASSPKEAMEKITLSILKQNPNLGFQTAQAYAHKAFDLIIFCNKDELGRRKITSISQNSTDIKNDCKMEDIIKCNLIGEHQSSGIVPDFYEITKGNAIPISANIFDINYKHTYAKNYKEDALAQLGKKNLNMDILKKFKKDLPMQDEQEDLSEVSDIEQVQEDIQEIETLQEEVQENNETQIELNEDEIVKKAQEKFDELRRNAQNINFADFGFENKQENKEDEVQYFESSKDSQELNTQETNNENDEYLF